MSTSGQSQFRFTQTPSKVLHLRNLPWECTEEELVELGKPFGKIVNTKCNVGANRNQAFVDDRFFSKGRVRWKKHTKAAVGPDGKKRESESNVLLASMENMQYAVTVDVLHTVFSAFGTVQKIAIFEKNGGTQALIQYPDVAAAVVAKYALEGHCIYDGGYCKLHLSYSRHTDLNVKAYSDKSRDYTIPESGLLAMQQATGAHAAATVWQNPQAAPAFPGSQLDVGGTAPAQAHVGQVHYWDPNMQAGRQTFASASGTFPGQAHAPPSVLSCATAAVTVGSSPLMHTGQSSPTVPLQGVYLPSHQPNQ